MTPRPAWFDNLKPGEGAARLNDDRASRKAAGQIPRSIILSPRDVQGQYDAGRMLYTTLGGQYRPLNADDLAAFRANIKTVGGRYQKGITARQIVDLAQSKPLRYVDGKRSDIDRAREEIRFAVPLSLNNGVMRLVTNAGPDTQAKPPRHHVIVKFLSFSAAGASGRNDSVGMAKWLCKQPVAFECDCGRHRYFFRYLATIGGFAAGRPETGYPKIRNPGLHGAACKHVLRVMSDIDRGHAGIVGLLAKGLDKMRGQDIPKRVQVRTSAEEADKLSRHGRSAIKTSADRKASREAAAARKAAMSPAPPAAAPAAKPSQAQRAISKAIERGALTEAQVAGMRALNIPDEMIAKMTRK